MAYALDYTGARYDFDAMKANGVVGVVRYTKYITSAEAAAIRGAGLALALVEETTANMTDGGFAAGVARGQHANAVADAIGFPRDRPIFYAVDHDVTSANDEATITAFLAGAESVGRRSEVYGEFDVVEAQFAAGASTSPWQCAAWSYHRRSSHAVIYQRIDHPIYDISVDVNDVLAEDWGAWGNTVTGAPIPTPVPTKRTVEPMISSGKNTDGRREFASVSSEGRVMTQWEDGHGHLSPWAAPSTDLGSIVACEMNENVAADGKVTLYIIAEDGMGGLHISMQSAPGLGPWTPWVNYADWLHFCYPNG